MSTNPIHISDNPSEIRRGVRLWLRKQVVFLIVLAAILFSQQAHSTGLKDGSVWD